MCKRKNISLHINEEHFTSKTCTCCGHLHSNLGSSREYNCYSCGLFIDRDINGARNILLKCINTI